MGFLKHIRNFSTKQQVEFLPRTIYWESQQTCFVFSIKIGIF